LLWPLAGVWPEAAGCGQEEGWPAAEGSPGPAAHPAEFPDRSHVSEFRRRRWSSMDGQSGTNREPNGVDSGLMVT
jgi:hypothetical protein